MKIKSKHVLFTIVAMIALTLYSNCYAADATIGKDVNKSDISLKNEINHAIDKGLKWLKSKQDQKGFWSQPEYPALSGLVLTAYMGDPQNRFIGDSPEFIKKGYDYILKCVQPDGGIYISGLGNYNTSVSLMALHVAKNPAYEDVIKNARNYLVSGQAEAESGDEFAGGIGYGDRYKHSDMSNTMFALEALYYTKYLEQNDNTDNDEYKKLNWKAVIKFIERCQNLPGHNDQEWASDDSVNKGGFIYFPGDSKAGEMTLPSGKKALRSYGSISYAGLLSLIYADVDKNDPRVTAVADWLKKNYTLEENPGMGAEGLYYYYHTMAKAMAMYGLKEITLENGRTINWRKDLALHLLNLQNGDGFWVNENGRWWEKDPVLVTSYAIIALEILYRGL